MKPTTQQWTARLLIVSLLQPAMILPARALDTDVYSGFYADSATTIKPNILLVLDTSDSMNLPEAWREYPGAYDSHVEYLWNDLNMIVDADNGAAGEMTAEDTNGAKISTAAVPQTFDSKAGFWGGATLAERRGLWQGARAFAKATEGSDPGARSIWRNYDDLSWIYWLPTGTAETDGRLRSPAWNRFRGYIKELGNGSGGSQRRGLYFTDSNDYRIYNQCNASLADLTPSTVFVPSDYAKNSGKYIGQQWARWEPYLNLTGVNIASYPGSSATNSVDGTNYTRGYLDASSPSTGDPASNVVKRDSTGTRGSLGLPIRYNAGSAGSGWDEPKADLGGYNFRAEINNYTDKTKLESIMGLYGLPAVTDVDSSGTTTIADSKFVAWKGNRDDSAPAAAFGSVTGAPAYYDSTAATCSSSTGPASSTCIDKPSGTNVSAITITKTAPCVSNGSGETDANGSTFTRGGSCVVGTITTSGDTNGTAYPNASDVPDPTVCPSPTTANSTITTAKYSDCAMTVTQAVAATTCSLTGNQQLTVSACAPSGGTAVNVGNCSFGSTRSSLTVNSCNWSGRQNLTIGTCSWSGRSAVLTEGIGYYATGGTCQENGRTAFCSSGNAPTGAYATQAAALAAISSGEGCSNTKSAGTYGYGGTCTENGSSEECAITGGSSPAGYPNLGSNCGNANSPSPGTYYYGGTCTENGSAASCQITGGTNVTIRGQTILQGQTCSNKADSGSTKNAAGTYYHSQTCAGTNNTCSNGANTTFTIRGTNYTTVGSCNSTYTAGTYNRGGTCSGTNSPCQIVTNYGGSTVSSGGNTYYANIATCTSPSGAQYYNSACTGTMSVMPGYPPGGNAQTTNNTAAACNSTTNTVTLGGTTYTNYVTCTNKTNGSTTCSTRYGQNCVSSCGNATSTSVTGGGSSETHNYYRTYRFANSTDYLYHDCKADDGGSSYMKYTPASPGSFGAQWNASSSYASTSTNGVTASDAKKIDMYSVNYLNWKFGAKVCRNADGSVVTSGTGLSGTAAGVTCTPIGRKTRLQIAKDVLSDVVGNISGIRMGLMSFNQLEKTVPSGALVGNSSGAHLDKAVKDLDSSTRPALISRINALKASSATPLTESLYEAYRYFRGDTPLFGGATYQAMEARNSPVNGNTVYVTNGLDTSTDALTAGGAYKSPITDACQENFVIFVSDGAPENDTTANSNINALPTVNGVSIAQSTTSGQFEASAGVPFGPPDPVGNAYVLMDELAYYMARVDMTAGYAGSQVVKLHTIGFGIDAPILSQAAAQGKGNTYQATNADTLKAALEAAIKAVAQWQPQGSAPAINYQLTTGASDDVYVAFFTPGSNKTWPGTIKKYVYGFGDTVCGPNSCRADPDYPNVELPSVCLTGLPTVTYGSCGKNVEYVESASENLYHVALRKIRTAAVSYWGSSGNPDGGSGTKGGTGAVLMASMTPASRNLYTFIPGSSTQVALSHATNQVNEANLVLATNIDLDGDGTVDTGSGIITKTMMGNASMTDANMRELIRFARGSDGSNLTTWRPWAQFDSVHSAPIVDSAEIKPSTSPKTYYSTLYFMTSDGVLHAVDISNGQERWAFMVPEALAKLGEIKTNAVGDHLEVADGSPVLVTTHDNKRLVIFGMRRGGRAYYALDVTDQTAPRFAWKISNTQICDGASCSTSTDFNELGYTWSTPAVGTIRGYFDAGANASSTADDKLKPVLVFGGGYDPNQDGSAPGVDSMGRAVFVVDAKTGSKIAQIDLKVGGTGYSVPSDVLALDTTGDANGTLDRVYVGDMGGRLWRIDLDDRSTTNPVSSWKTKVVRLADLAKTGLSTKIFQRPVMAPAVFRGQVFDAVFVGTGDIQRPTEVGDNDSGAMFMVKDFDVGKVATQASAVASASVSTDFVDMTSRTAADSLTTVTGTSATGSTVGDDLKASRGYYIRFGQDTVTEGGTTTTVNKGEKVTSAAQVFQGVLYFGTFLPSQSTTGSSGQCSLGGYGRQYAIDALTGMPLYNGNTLVNPYGNGRVYGFVAGMGVPLNVIGGPGKGIYLHNRATSAHNPASTLSRAFWYTVPER